MWITLIATTVRHVVQDLRGTDRFSGLNIRHVHATAKDFGVNEKRAAKEVLKYAEKLRARPKWVEQQDVL